MSQLAPSDMDNYYIRPVSSMYFLFADNPISDLTNNDRIIMNDNNDNTDNDDSASNPSVSNLDINDDEDDDIDIRFQHENGRNDINIITNPVAKTTMVETAAADDDGTRSRTLYSSIHVQY